jgi:hypothetical protein
MAGLNSDVAIISRFAGPDLRVTIAEIESTLQGEAWHSSPQRHSISPLLPRAAFNLKYAAAQIDNVVHALGILTLLPVVVAPFEVIKELSLSAGTGGKHFDLRTDYRIAEFKFVNWQSKGNSVRHQAVFRDFVKLAESKSRLHKQLFLIDCSRSTRWLLGRTSLESALKKDVQTLNLLRTRYGRHVQTVAHYYCKNRHKVELVDILELEPGFKKLEPAEEEHEV